MGRKTNKQLIIDQLARQLTVGELKKRLNDFPDDMIVCRVGHYGEVNRISASDFCRGTACITGSGNWRDSNQQDVQVIHISVPDIGEDPD